MDSGNRKKKKKRSALCVGGQRESEFVLLSKTTSRPWGGAAITDLGNSICPRTSNEESRQRSVEKHCFRRRAGQPTALSSVRGCAIALFHLSLLLSLTLRLTLLLAPSSSSSTRPTPPSSSPLSHTLNSHPYTHTRTINTHYPDNHRQPSTAIPRTMDMSQAERQKYAEIFTSLNPINGYITGNHLFST